MGNWLSYEERVYGWKKDKEDKRDLYKKFGGIYPALPGREKFSTIDLREQCPEIYDQGQLGSCTANAISAAYEFDMMKEKEEFIFTPSRLFIYYNERKMEGNVDEDAGAEIRDGIKSVNKQGIVDEQKWPYIISNFTDEPPKKLYEEAKHHLAVKYQRIQQNLEHMKECLNEGFPFVFGFIVYESFESEETTNTGIMVMPKENERILGGHSCLVVGYDDDKKVFIVRNSWSSYWGDYGYFYMPYEYMLNEEYCSDCWLIQRVQDDNKYKKLMNKLL